MTTTQPDLAARLAERLERARARLDAPAPRSAPTSVAPMLSAAQRRIWFHEQRHPGTAGYNMPIAWRIRGALDRAALLRSLHDVVERHEVLRTCYRDVDGTPEPVLQPATELRIAEATIAADAVVAWADDAAGRPFALERELPIRADLARIGAAPEEHVLVLTVHHIAADGWSIGVIAAEIAARYRGEPLQPPTQYWAAAQREADVVARGAFAPQLAHWRERLAGAPERTDVPSDRPRPARRSGTGAILADTLGAELATAVRDAARTAAATPFMVLLASFQVACARWTGRPDAVVGTPISGRDEPWLEAVVGCFVNTMAVRGAADPAGSFRDLIATVRRDQLRDTEHAGVPFDLLVQELAPDRRGGQPLVQVMFAATEVPANPLDLPGLAVEELPVDPGAAKLDLSLAVDTAGPGMPVALTFDADLFDASAASRLLSQWRGLLAALLAAPDRPIGEVTLPERPTTAIDSAPIADGATATVLRRIGEQVRLRPDAVAVTDGRTELTYRQLHGRASALAQQLRERGAGPDVVIGLHARRSTDTLVGLLAVLLSGAAYLPIDPATPAARRALLLELAGADLLVSAEPLDAGPVTVVPVPDHNGAVVAVPAEPEPGHLAYVIFTSGSTGTPKAVAVEHGQLGAYVDAIIGRLAPAPGRSFAVASTLAADLGHTTLFPALCTGGALHLLDDTTAGDPALFAARLRAHPVDHLKIVPSHLAALLAAQPSDAVLPRTALVLGGEALGWPLVEQVRALRPALRILNHYGPTETTVGALTYEVPRELPARGTTVPIGRPLPHMRARVLDERGRPVLEGAAGELWLSGAAVARGYLRDPAATALRFRPVAGARSYGTGDRVRVRADGNVEFLGRIDGQLKIRGHRVEPGEVEACLRAHPAVDAAACLPVEGPGGLSLVAYVRATAGAEELTRFAAQQLPAALVPSAIVVLDAFPLTSNGKLDRAALPAPELTPPPAAVAPSTPVEEALATIFGAVLGSPPPSVHNDFFALGGHSLLAMQVVARCRRDLDATVAVAALFENPTVAGLAGHIEDLRRAAADPARDLPVPRPAAADAPLLLSRAQQRLWFLDQTLPGNPAYNLPYALRLHGELDVRALREALNLVVARHNALRTVIGETGGVPEPVIRPAADLALPIVDVGPDADRLHAEVARQFEDGFDLARGPLLRASLLRVAAAEHVLLITFHHIAFDGWSWELFLDELEAGYVALRAGTVPALPAVELDYADYARWQESCADHPALRRELAYWSEQLAGAPLTLELPTDHPRPPRQRYRGATVPIALPATLTADVQRLARRCDATPFMVLLAAYQAVLARYTGQQDLLVGTPTAGRTHAELEPLIGFFVTMLPLRADLSGEPTFREFLDRVRATTLGAFSHQSVPFERIVDELGPERDPSRQPVFQTLFALQTAARERSRLADLRVEPVAGATGIAKYDLSLVLVERGGALTGALEFNTDLFEPATAQRFAAHFATLLAAAVAAPDTAVSALPLADAAQRRLVLDGFTPPALPYRTDARITDLIGDQVTARPDAVAVIGPDETLNYRQLDERARRVAGVLAAHGVGRGDVVGLHVERSAAMLVGILAVLHAGAAYLPLDPDYPAERLDNMLADAGATVLLSQRALHDRRPSHPGPVVLLDDAGAIAGPPFTCTDGSPADPAYVIYTSGSTGRPKGVQVAHRSVVNLLAAGAASPPLAPGDVVLAIVSLSFDVSVWELLSTLAAGATLHVAPRDVVTDGVRLAELLSTSGATVLNAPNAVCRLLVDAGWAGDRRVQVITGGEPLTRDLAARLLERVGGLWNQYGPTEATVYCTVDDVRPGTEPTLGVGAANTYVRVLDEHGQPVPVGVPGEIYVGGAGVAIGYLHRPELTAARFVPDPFGDRPGARLYRTGDLGRWRADGRLLFLGRRDGQVKLRGYRIETGEIEAVLAEHPGVRRAVVDLRADDVGDLRLVAWVVAPGSEVAQLRAHLARTLPAHMVPSAFVLLDRIPTTPNGKTDRRALPAPVAEPAGAVVAPRTATERRVVGAFAAVLGRAEVGIDDDFFAIGGESLKAVRAVRQIAPDLAVLDLFSHPTARALAAHLDAGAPAGATGLLHLLTSARAENAEVTLVCVPFGGGSAISYRPLADALPATWALHALELPAHDYARRDEGLVPLPELAVAAAEEICSAVSGDVVLYGHCVGSALAVAIAHELERRGEVTLRGVVVGANFPAARLPGWLGRAARLWPGRKMSDRALQDSLRVLGAMSDTLDDDERRVLARNVRHDGDEAERFYTAAFAAPDEQRLAAPILCVVGSADRAMDFAAEQVAEWRLFSDRVDLAVIPDAGHFFNRGQAPELAELIVESVAAPPPAPAPTPVVEPRFAAFLVVAFGQLVSLIGTGLTTFALGVWAYQQTGSLATFAGISVMGMVPPILAAPFAGVVADRFDRRRVMLACDAVGLLGAAALVVLFLAGGMAIWHLYVLAGISATAATFRQPAYLAGSTQLVPKRYLGNASGVLQLGTAGGLLVAQLLGGALLTLVGIGGAVVVDVVSYLVALATLAAIRFPDTLFRTRVESFRAELVGGWHYLVARRPLVVLTAFFTVANALGGFAVLLVTPLVLSYASAATLGVVLAAQGAGMLAGGALVAAWGGARRRSVGMIASVGLFGGSAVLIGLSPNAVVAGFGMAGIGLCGALINAHWLAFVQVKVPPLMQGRVVATCLMLARLLTPVAFLLAEPAANALRVLFPTTGTDRALAVAVVLTGALSLLWTAVGWCLRSLRDADDSA